MRKVSESSRDDFQNKNGGARDVDIFSLHLRLSVLFSRGRLLRVLGITENVGAGYRIRVRYQQTLDFAGPMYLVGIGRLTARMEIIT